MAYAKYRPVASTKTFVPPNPIETGYQAPTLMKPHGHGPIPLEAILRPDSVGKRRMGISSVSKGLKYAQMHFGGFEMHLVGIKQSVFTECLFEEMNFSGCHFSEVEFVNCVFLKCTFSRSYFRKCAFTDCSFGGATFEACRIATATFTDCAGDRLKGVVFEASTGYAVRFINSRVLPRCTRPRDVGLYLTFDADTYRPAYAVGTSGKSFASVWAKVGARDISDILVMLDEMVPLAQAGSVPGYDILVGLTLEALRLHLGDHEAFAAFAEKSGILSAEQLPEDPAEEE